MSNLMEKIVRDLAEVSSPFVSRQDSGLVLSPCRILDAYNLWHFPDLKAERNNIFKV